MKTFLIVVAAILAAFVIIVVGCSALVASSVDDATAEQSWRVEITAPDGAEWSGHVGDHSIDGSGSDTEEFSDMAITAAVVQKQDGGSWELHVALVGDDGEIVDEASTNAVYGIVTVDGTDF